MKDKPVILIVDDQPQNLELLEAHLVPRGYEIVKAASGEEALQKLAGNQIDLVLLDVVMPGMDGFEATRRIRQEKAHRLIPIILVTALQETEDRVKGIEAGCDDFLSKPFDKMELLARVRSLLKVKDYNDLKNNYRQMLEAEVSKGAEELKRAWENQQQDSTERKQEEANTRRLVTVVRDSNDAITVQDFGGQILTWNRGAELMYGYGSAEAMQMNLERLIPREKVAEHEEFTRRLLSGETITSFETQRVTKDGRVIDVWLTVTKIVDDAGKPIGIASTGRDITGRKLAEQELRNSKEQLEQRVTERTQELHDAGDLAENVINTVREPLLALDQDLRVVKASRSFYEFFKVKPEETVGQLIYDLGDKQWDIPKLRELLETILPQKTSFDDYEVEHDFTTIGRRVMLLNARQIERAMGKQRIILLAIEDITERKRADELIKLRTAQLDASNKELESFAYSVSHDLRVPLRAIDGFSMIVAEDYADKLDDEGRRLLKVVRDNTLKMGKLIDDLLAYSRMGQKQVAAGTVNMAALARSVADEVAQANPERQVAVTIGTLPPATGDALVLRQAMINLVANSFKFTRPKSDATVEIGCDTVNGENWYFVRDNGVGFDMRYADKLFGVFQRLHSQDEFEGTGVGLAIVQRVIHKHGGKIKVEGEVGKGATFRFSLPG